MSEPQECRKTRREFRTRIWFRPWRTEKQPPDKNRGRALTGAWEGYRECHIQPDWLPVYKIYEDKLTLALSRTGSHSDLDFFGAGLFLDKKTEALIVKD